VYYATEKIKMQVVSSVKKSTDLLKLFTADNPEWSLAELSDQIDLHKSSIHRTLNTLVGAGFLEKDPVTGRYRLGLILLELAGNVLSRYDFREIANPYLENLAQKTGEIIHLSILDGSDIVYLDKIGISQPLTVSTNIGGRSPAYSSAMGKVLLADLEKDEVVNLLGKKPLKKMTHTTITEKNMLLSVLECVKADGYAIDDEEAFLGIRCVAAPLKNRGGRVIAAISATVPIQRMDRKRTEELCAMVVKTASEISDRGIDSGY
jgi:IclR family transcriptional regulator, KDG regulon repressor